MRYMLLVFFGACSYGILSTIVKLAYGEGFSASQVIGGQMVFGFLLAWIPALFYLHTKPKKDLLLLLAGVGIVVGTTGIMYYNALQYIPASLAILLLFQFTWMGVLAESIMSRKRPDKPTLCSLLLLFFGTILAGGLLENEGLQQFELTGIIFGLLSAVSYTLFIIFSSRTALSVNPWLRSSSMSTGSLLLTCLIYPPVFLIDGTLWDGLFPYVFLLALFGILIPTACFNFGVPHIGTGMAAILGAAELPTAIFSSYIVLQENVSWLQVTGVLVILLGIMLPKLLQRKIPKLSRDSL